MKVLVVGYGSMGRRRIRLVQQLEKDCEVICVDSNSERLEQAKSNGVKGFLKLEDAVKENPDVAFVSTSPATHESIILYLLENKINTFTELNLIDKNYDKMISLAKENNTKLFMSSTMLYNKQITAIQDIVKTQKKKLTYIYHVGQYLPDWHTWESYKNFFVSKKETNGCREIYAIQLPWIVDTFGDVDKVVSTSNRSTELEIDYNDSYVTMITHKNGNQGVFVVDVVSRKAVTSLEVIGEDIHVMWDGSPEGLFSFNTETKKMEKVASYSKTEHLAEYADNIIEDDYLDEVRDFLNYVKTGNAPKYSLEKDKVILSLIDKIEEA